MTKPAEKIYLLDKKVTLWQIKEGFKASGDSVFVAAACPVKSGQSVLDMGCSAGNITFPLLWRVPQARITGIDIQQDYLDLAEQNRIENQCTTHTNFICADIRDFAAHNPHSYDHIVTNPPYMEAGKHTPSPAADKALAKGHILQDSAMTLKDWLKSAHMLLKSGGTLTLIHRADALDQIICHLGTRFGATEIIPLYSKTGQDAKRIIIRTIKDRKTSCRLHEGILIHKQDGSYTTIADKILRGHAAI